MFYAPFSTVWLLDGTGDAVQSTARLTRTRNQLYLDRGTATLLVSPDLPADTGTPGAHHPLALFHDRLLSQPLARPVAGIPADSRFVIRGNSRSGIVRGPDGAAPQPAGATLWRSLGDHIVVTRGDGQSETLHWTVVDKALKGHDG